MSESQNEKSEQLCDEESLVAELNQGEFDRDAETARGYDEDEECFRRECGPQPALVIEASPGLDLAYSRLKAVSTDRSKAIDLIRSATRCAATACLAMEQGGSCRIRLRYQPEEIDGSYFYGIVEMTPMSPHVDFRHAFNGDGERMIAMAGSMALVEVLDPMFLGDPSYDLPKLWSLASRSAIEPYLRRIAAKERELLGVSLPTIEGLDCIGDRFWHQLPTYAELIRAMEKTREVIHNRRAMIDALVVQLLRCHRQRMALELNEDGIDLAIHRFRELGGQEGFLPTLCGLFLKEWDPHCEVIRAGESTGSESPSPNLNPKDQSLNSCDFE